MVQPDEMCRVVLRDFPLRTMFRAQQHGEELLREFALIAHSSEADAELVPRRLLELAEASGKRYDGLNPHAEDVIDDALSRGERYVDLELFVPASFREETLDAVPVLLEVEEYCRNGQMLTLLPTAEVRTFWMWYLGEFVRQVAGQEPVSWRDWAPPDDDSAAPPSASPPATE